MYFKTLLIYELPSQVIVINWIIVYTIHNTESKVHEITGTGCPVALHVKLWDPPAVLIDGNGGLNILGGSKNEIEKY